MSSTSDAITSSHQPARSPERSFGLSVGGVLAGLSVIALWRAHPTPAMVYATLATVLILPALLRPSWLRIPSAAWWRLSGALGWVNARVLLSVVFFALVTPLGLIMRLAGKDPLRRRAGATASLWTPYPIRQHDPKHYDRMF